MRLGTFDVAVTVTPVDEPPAITGTTTFPNWRENDGSTISTLTTAVDPEGNTPITWSLGRTRTGATSPSQKLSMDERELTICQHPRLRAPGGLR